MKQLLLEDLKKSAQTVPQTPSNPEIPQGQAPVQPQAGEIDGGPA
jgi:hypothetical protein